MRLVVQGDIPGHRRVADKNVFLERADIQNLDRVRRGKPFLIGLFSSHIEFQRGLFAFGNPGIYKLFIRYGCGHTNQAGEYRKYQ